MLRISVTDIDSYRYWRDHAEDASIDDLRARLLHRQPPTDAMKIGTLLHGALEKATPGETILRLGDDTLRLSVECELHVPMLPVRECKIEQPVIVPGFGSVMLVGKVDASDRATVVDYKTTSRFDPEALFDAMQWRYYLWLLMARRFVWEVFEIRDQLQAEPNVYRLSGHHHVEQWAYPGMEDHCERGLVEFCDVVTRHVPEYVTAKTMAA